MTRFIVRIVALLCVVSCATLAAVDVWPAHQRVWTGDLNGDGRVDLWRRFDAHGQLTEIDRDTNFDGIPDVEEYYQRGVLVRRESDRNFNGQTDLVEEFDPDSQGQTRSVVDVDYDGTADLLVLFRDGRPVYSKQICAIKKVAENPSPNPTADRPGDGAHLTALIDPFESDAAIRRARVEPGEQECVGLSTSGGLPSPRFALLGGVAPSASLVISDVALDPITARPHASRAPPVS